ncbi:MAG: proline--tRNA ligase [Methanosarcinales archaeon]|nr:MAG: proline--tRNA ligase [Methanosarcinales archaeon]
MEKNVQQPKLPQKSRFSEWYNELLAAAEVMDVRYPVKGLYVWHPFGFSLRNKIYSIIRELLDNDGHEEALFPLLIPENEFMKEAEHIKGFEDEVYWVTHGGVTPLDVKLALRPTSETAIYPMYKLWIRSHADMPLKLYQIVNTFRYETKHTRPLIRLREITSFKEAHTVHTDWDDAAKHVDRAIELYQEFYRRLGVPTIVSKRPSWDKFPGADYTLAVDTLMPDSKVLQIGTAHHLADNFAKTFGITYEDPTGEQIHAHQTCYGISERSVAAVISVHGDDHGLVLPPEVAPVQVVIVPILFGDLDVNEKVLETCRSLRDRLTDQGLRVRIDDSEDRPGAKYYRWELRGVPIRVELGPRDLAKNSCMLVRRDTAEKRSVSIDGAPGEVQDCMKTVVTDMYHAARDTLDSRIFDCETLDDVSERTANGIARICWCLNEDCGREMEDVTGVHILGIPVEPQGTTGPCPICGRDGTPVLMARTY